MFNTVQRSTYFDLSEQIQGYDLPTEMINGKRHYVTPSGNRYPSVTTVLSTMSAQGIAEWRARVGDEEANRISTQAAGRGTRVHTLAEKYLQNKDDYAQGAMPVNIAAFNQIKSYLDKHCDKVYANEIALYSDNLMTAGRCDGIIRLHGVRTVVDFKTAKRAKKEAWIQNYFLQCAVYAIMLFERTKLWCPQFCVLIATDEDGLQPILKQTAYYAEEAQDFFYQYHKRNTKL